jgi:hypothetical protein
MADEKAKLDFAVKTTGAILEEHLGAIPAAKAKAMRREIHSLFVKPFRFARTGKASVSRRTAGPRPLSRTSAERS